MFPKVLTVALSLAVSLPVSAQEVNERALNTMCLLMKVLYSSYFQWVRKLCRLGVP